MLIKEFQQLMRDLYFKNDSQRGLHRTTLWLAEEVGELMSELKNDPLKVNIEKVKEEIADVYAWVASIANLLDIDLENALQLKYNNKCPKCGRNPCICRKNLP